MKKVITIFLLLIATVMASQKLQTDRVTGLVDDIGLQDVKENCTVCHTGRFIVINGGNKKFWAYKIGLMQNAFGLWKLKPEVKKRIINYLSKYYYKKHNISLEEK